MEKSTLYAARRLSGGLRLKRSIRWNMEKEVPLYKMIYNKIVNRILTGLYPKGYVLSSVQKIHAEHHVGYTSIRRAMHLLQQEGFIQLEERKRPVVVFDEADPRSRELRWRVFLSRRRTHLDCYRAIPCLIPGLVMLGARRCTPKLLEALEGLCAQPEGQLARQNDLLVLVYTWQALVVQQADNDLAADLFLQIRGFDDLRFIVMPSAPLVPGEARAALQYLRHWTKLLRAGDLDSLHTLVSIFCQQAMCGLERAFLPLAELPELQSVRQVEFNWYVRQSPAPLYKKIAYDLLRTVHLEGMGAGDSFPSEAALMEQYGVAAVTVRGALALLNSLGVAQTVNGVGTLFTGACAYTPEARPYLRECCESLDVLAGCGRALALAAAQCMPEEGAAALRAGAEARRTREGLVLWMLRQFVCAVPSQALENVFDQLETRYIFGLYVSGLPGAAGRRGHQEEVYGRAMACLDRLEEGDGDAFADGFSRLCQDLRDELGAQLAHLLG